MTPAQVRTVRITGWMAVITLCAWLWAQAPGAIVALLHALR